MILGMISKNKVGRHTLLNILNVFRALMLYLNYCMNIVQPEKFRNLLV